MKLCTRCRTVLYCSRECQMKNWQAHKFLCGPNPQQGIPDHQDTPVCNSLVFVLSSRNKQPDYRKLWCCALQNYHEELRSVET